MVLAPATSVATANALPEGSIHHLPAGFSDHFALGLTKVAGFVADTFFAKRYGHRAVVLETIAAVPGMVGATINHLNALRRMRDDDGWIRILLEEAENERMHLMTFVEIARPTQFERFVVILVQWLFYIAFFALYLVSSRTAHRVVGYFEEEAVLSYTLYLQDIDAGRSPNVPAPLIARRYWMLPENATLRDVILVVRADEAHHRDVNHGFATQLRGLTWRAVTINLRGAGTRLLDVQLPAGCGGRLRTAVRITGANLSLHRERGNVDIRALEGLGERVGHATEAGLAE